MLSRKDFLEEVFQECLDEKPSKDFFKKQVEYLKEVTDGTVLYKYCSVSDGAEKLKDYVLDAIKKQTLSCSNPMTFNDPFDCKVGMTIKALFEFEFEKEKDFIDQIVSEINAVLDGKKSLKSMHQPAMRVYSKVVTNKEIIHAIKQSKLKDSQTEWDLSTSKAVFAIVNILVDEVNLPIDIQILRSLLPRFESIISNSGIRLLDSPDADICLEAFLKQNGIEDVDEVKGLVQFSKILYPDKSDSVDEAGKMFYDFQDQINRKVADTFRVASLGESYRNRLMWSHYSANHSGICIEYDFSKMSEGCPLPIFYSQQRPQITSKKELGKTILRSIYTKDEVWEYEKEWRYIIKTKDNSKTYQIVNVPISRVYLGAEISENDKKAVIKAAYQSNIPVSQMEMDCEKFELHTSEISFEDMKMYAESENDER